MLPRRRGALLMAWSMYSSSRQDAGMAAEEFTDRLHEMRKIGLFGGQRQVDHAALCDEESALDHLELEQSPHGRRERNDLTRMRDRSAGPMRVEDPADAGGLERDARARSDRIELLAQPISARVERAARLRRIHISGTDETGAHRHDVVVESATLRQ